MASSNDTQLVLKLALLVSLLHFTSAARKLTQAESTSKTQEQAMLFQYHNGPLLAGKISANLIWYGNFKPSQKAIISDFVASLSLSSTPTNQPSVVTWWKSVQNYYRLANPKGTHTPSLTLGKNIVEKNYTLGKTLTIQQIKRLASKGDQTQAINVVLTSSDVAVDGFCRSSCGSHGSSLASKTVHVKGRINRFAYIWVGNSETQCPGYCAWPFHQPIYGPQNPPLVAPNDDVGLDGMVINLASMLAGTVTNPLGKGYYMGPAEAPLEAGSACTGVYGSGAYPGYAGNLLLDPTTGASYNANGINGRKYLVPALFDPKTSSCSTLV